MTFEKERRKINIITTISLVLLGISILMMIYTGLMCSVIKQSYGLYNVTPDTFEFGLNGLYYGNHYYCVNTLMRTQTSIEKTDYHEDCHNLVHSDYDHFCFAED